MAPAHLDTKLVVLPVRVAREVRSVGEWALVIGLNKVLGRIARKLHCVAKLSQLLQLPRRGLPARHRFALALFDHPQPLFRLLHAKACSTTVKVISVIAPQVAAFAQVLLGARADVVELLQNLNREGIASRMIDARGTEPAPFQEVLCI
eukprot:scaffold124406_cov32-Tisochrysis_lutea.AAC.2